VPKKPETRFKEKIRPLLDALPRSWWVKTQMVALRGIPDMLGCVNGHFIAMELKVDDVPDALQEWNLDKIAKANGVPLTVTPENWEQVYQTLLGVALGKLNLKPEMPDEPAKH
jgi:hypothetical protein